VVFSIVAIGSVDFYVISLNQKYFHMNKSRNSTREMEFDFDMVDYDDWNFMNSVFRMN
jgi:hypothetical protein